MGNMSYCRFQNTLTDLRDCKENLCEDDLSTEERRARKLLIKICREIVIEADDQIDDGFWEKGKDY